VIGGFADLNNGITHAFLYSAGKMMDLGGLPGFNFTTASAVNASGQVVGWAENPQRDHVGAFLYTSGQMINLGTLPGDTSAMALAINSHGTVVGTSFANAASNAFIYQNGVMTDLNALIPSTSDFHLMDGRAVNDAGQILADGQDGRGTYNAYLLTPSNMPAPVAPELYGTELPEPSTLVFASLLATLAGARKGLQRLRKVR
jgi:probable HAF family extracellular repeat protein